MGRRVAGGLAAAVVGLLLATFWGAPVGAALLAFVAGAAGALVLVQTQRAPAPAVETAPPDAAAALERAESDILEAVDDPLLIVAERRVVYANPAARQVLGPHIEGVDVRLAIRHPAAAERLTDRDVESAERVTRTDLIGLGEPDRRWEMTATRLGGGRHFVRLIDRSEAHASEQMRVDFVANASHELRTPLATLLGFLETLQDEQAASDAKTRSRFVRIMFDEARRMHRLVDDLISLSRIEAERFSVPREPVDLASVVEEVRASLGSLVEQRGSCVRIERGELAPVVAGDRPQLVQLVHNLFVNALKYGRPESEVTVRFVEAGPDMLRMSVVDQGEGIPPEHLPRLTERFYRVDPGRSRAVGGTGLGLAIVKHIVGRHRGRLEIRSTLGVGTSVLVYLPRIVTNP